MKNYKIQETKINPSEALSSETLDFVIDFVTKSNIDEIICIFKQGILSKTNLTNADIDKNTCQFMEISIFFNALKADIESAKLHEELYQKFADEKV